MDGPFFRNSDMAEVIHQCATHTMEEGVIPGPVFHQHLLPVNEALAAYNHKYKQILGRSKHRRAGSTPSDWQREAMSCALLAVHTKMLRQARDQVANEQGAQCNG